MKYSIIEDIFYNGCGYNENMKPSEEYLEKISKLADLCGKFSRTLNEAQRNEFEEINDLQMGAEADSALSHFKEGLKFGLLLFAECLHK